MSFAKRQASGSASEPATHAMDRANDRVASLLTKDFRKFVKIFTYLKVRTDIRAMDDQIHLYCETNAFKAFES